MTGKYQAAYELQAEELAKRFKCPPGHGDAGKHICNVALAMAQRIVQECRPGRYTSLALTDLESCVSWCLKAIESDE